MKISKFGNKITSKSGISILMDDLGEALTTRKDIIMLGGGNPAHIPQVQAEFRRCLADLLKDKSIFNCAFGNYDPPTGNIDFIYSLCKLLNDQFGWGITPQNIALTNGSQTAFFVLFNLFAGQMPDGSVRKILLPLAPEYIGYSDVGITGSLFSACRPDIRILDNGMFKYCIDFDRLEITDEIGAICVSRPTNPTGNVLTDQELYALSELAQQHDIPLIIDNAYGTPFPNIIFTDANPIFNENTIVCMSLSKLGLPAVRTGIVIAQPNIIEMVREFNAVVSLSPGGIGPAMTHQLFGSGKIIDICRNMIKPYYQQKAENTVKILQEKLKNIDFLIHKPEGALFLWIWFRDLSITSRQLYQKLKENGVLVVPGNFFFPGLEDDSWPHKEQCIRLNYSQDSNLVEKGIDIIAKVINNS